MLDRSADSYICVCEMSSLKVYPKESMKACLAFVLAVLVCTGCSGNNENAHTTATTVVPPPPRQVLKAYTRPRLQSLEKLHSLPGIYDPSKPLLHLILPMKTDFREGEEVVIDFWLENAKLRGDGGEYRVRYLVDDDDAQWVDRWEQVVLSGWLPGKHTIRVELIGPDGWPYRNGDYNIATREILVSQ